MSNPDQEMWNWKYEPVSPVRTPPLEIDDNWLLFDDKSVVSPKNAVEPVMYDDSPSRAQVARKLLDQLDEWIKEEPFSDWLEEKIEDLPIFEQLPVSENSQVVKPPLLIYPTVAKQPQQLQQQFQLQQQQHQDDTQTLLQEFETVLGDVEACHHQIIVPSIGSSTLTPPQSPPHKVINVDTQLLVTLQPVQSQAVFTSDDNAAAQQPCVYNMINVPTEESLYASDDNAPRDWSITENISLSPYVGSDAASDLAVVDEYVRTHAKDLPSPSSPGCASSSGSSSGCASSTEDSTDDPDWSLESERNDGAAKQRSDRHHQSSYDSTRHRHKPYSRVTLEDKKVRKKEQNKNAATRYRQKKKQEIKEILGEEQELAEHNEKLKAQTKDLQREIGYLKGLMRELFRAKGLL